jgi:hypothetical protein
LGGSGVGVWILVGAAAFLVEESIITNSSSSESLSSERTRDSDSRRMGVEEATAVLVRDKRRFSGFGIGEGDFLWVVVLLRGLVMSSSLSESRSTTVDLRDLLLTLCQLCSNFNFNFS